MYNKLNNKLSDQLSITHEKLGSGAFGNVYKARTNGTEVAIKCESKLGSVLTLLREFKLCRKLCIISKYIEYYYELLNITNNDDNKDNKDSNNDKDNKYNNNDKDKLKSLIDELIKNPIIMVYEYINKNDMLLMPNDYIKVPIFKYKIIPNIHSYIECNDFNFLTMDLCGDNFEKILEKYVLTDRSKYFIAHRLLYILSCIHRCGIIHRDIKLSNIVLNSKIEYDCDIDNINKKVYDMHPLLIDMGLGKDYYKYENNKIVLVSQTNTKNITGTLRYISLNVHEFKSPTIVDDLISLCYSLVVIMTNKPLPWIGHKKDTNKFDYKKHTDTNCKCGYHLNKSKNNTKHKNTISDVKFHTPLNELVGDKFPFLIKWIKYLYSLNPNQLPSYNYLYKILLKESSKYDNLYFEIDKILDN